MLNLTNLKMKVAKKLALVATCAAVLASPAMAADKVYRLKLAETWPTNFPIFGDATKNMAALADDQATTVVFMGKRTFPKLAHMLIAHGLPANTPALLAEAVATPEQALHRGTVTSLADRLAKENGTAPALILYGPLAES